ncbi:class I SAM-dependent methyltransferase [Dactylosporangium vinaceum]|uniref:Class I SAM-dependent methyltransferase n=1 Tax=Dactylosporangium vinaceum TaxID=53362 RepID=A0ABV5MAN1_9ACTN|nr:class I SAM-dependent methyltransferase [Dactylosporangium vinaceum]
MLRQQQRPDQAGIDLDLGRGHTGRRHRLLVHQGTLPRPPCMRIPLRTAVSAGVEGALPPGVALDAACGTGRYTAYLAQQGHRVIGVDSSPDMLAHARTRAPSTELRQGDLCELPLPDDHVDIVVCALALTHLPDVGPAIAEFARVLRPGGHLVITDVHQELVALGSVPRVRAGDGDPGLLPAFRHRASDYLRVALPLGLQVRRCEEPRMSGQAGGDMPAEIGTGPWDAWPWSLLDIVPAASGAAWDGTPSQLIWHFQLAPGTPR